MTDAMAQEPPAAPEPGEEWKPDGCAWTLLIGDRGNAVELWDDGVVRLTIPITEHEAMQLTGHPVTLAGALRADGFTVTEAGR